MGQLPLTNAQKDELDHRLQEMEHNSSLGIPWEEVLQKLEERALSS